MGCLGAWVSRAGVNRECDSGRIRVWMGLRLRGRHWIRFGRPQLVAAEVWPRSLGRHPDPLPCITLGRLPRLCAPLAPSVTREGWQEGQGPGVTWADRRCVDTCCGDPQPRSAWPVHTVASSKSLLPTLLPAALALGGSAWQGSRPLSSAWLGCQITQALTSDLGQCVSWWGWEDKFNSGAAMKCSENCFHVLVSGEAP